MGVGGMSEWLRGFDPNNHHHGCVFNFDSEGSRFDPSSNMREY